MKENLVKRVCKMTLKGRMVKKKIWKELVKNDMMKRNLIVINAKVRK